MLPVERVKEASNIVEVVSDYVRLEPKGGSSWGLCPFHKEKTPSFSVSETKGLYYCFGCGAGGDVIDFIKEIEGVDFAGAVRLLASRYGIEVDDSGDDKYSALNTAWESMRQNRHMAGRFLSARGIKTDDVGYDDGGWVKNVDARAARELGIGDEGRSWFRGRVVFPVRSGGRLVGLTGRILSGTGPKWFHSNFSRKSTVFLLDENRRAIKEAGYVVVVEGVIDAHRLLSAGIPAVAIFGARMSEVQASKLASLGVDVLLGLDRDGAGLDGALAAINLLRGRTIVRVVIWPNGYKDPGELPISLAGDAVDKAIAPAKFVYGYAKWRHRDTDRLMAWLKPWLEPATYADSVPTELASLMTKDGIVLPEEPPRKLEEKRDSNVVVERERLLEADIAAVLMSVSDPGERKRLAEDVEIGVMPEPGDVLVGVLQAVKSTDPVSVFRQIGAGGIFYRRIIEAPPYSADEAQEKLEHLVRALSIRKLQRLMREAFDAGDMDTGIEYANALEAVKRTRRV